MTKTVKVNISGLKEIRKIDERLTSYNVEMTEVTGGTFWKEYTPEEIADAFSVKIDLGLRGGMLVTNPIPEEYSMDPTVINKAIDDAVAECDALGIKGKDTTPFLLSKIKDITGGDSLASNIQLVYNNARLASEIAKSLVT